MQQKPLWLSLLMMLVRVAVFIMVLWAIMNADVRTIAFLAFVAAWFAFDPVKRWIERLANA